MTDGVGVAVYDKVVVAAGEVTVIWEEVATSVEVVVTVTVTWSEVTVSVCVVTTVDVLCPDVAVIV